MLLSRPTGRFPVGARDLKYFADGSGSVAADNVRRRACYVSSLAHSHHAHSLSAPLLRPDHPRHPLTTHAACRSKTVLSVQAR
jgi:hypothetical protein